MIIKNAEPDFLRGTTAPAERVVQFTVHARIQPARDGYTVRPVITAQDASGKNVNPPDGFVVPKDVMAACQAACNAALDQCAKELIVVLKAYGLKAMKE